MKQRLSYAIGDAGFNLVWVLFDSFLLYYFAEVFRLPAWALAPVLLAGRSADIVSGLLSGVWVDRTRSSFGVYRPVLLWTALPLSFSVVALFTSPARWPPGLIRVIGASRVELVSVGWVLLAAVVFAVLYSASNVSYTALLSVVTTSEQDRIRLASTRFVAAAAAVSAAQFFTLPAVSRLGQGNVAVGWQRMAILYAGIASLLLLGCFAGTREIVRPQTRPSENVAAALSWLARNRQMQWLLVAMVSSLAAFTCRGTVTPFFVKYNSGHPEWISVVLTSNSLSALGSCLLASTLPQRWFPPWRLSWVYAFLGAVLCLPPNLWAVIPLSRLIVLQSLFGGCTGMLVPTIFALFAESSATIEVATGRRVAGLVAGVSLLGLKLGAMLGSVLVSLLLAHLNFRPEGSLSVLFLPGIRFLFTYAPASLLFFTFLALRHSNSNR